MGSVTNITEFGVFVDLGGVEGLIHVSELSWGRVRHPSEVAKVGETVQAYVIQVDQDRSRIALSLKRLIPNPWETAEERYYPGQVVNAVDYQHCPFRGICPYRRRAGWFDPLIGVYRRRCAGRG